MHNGAVAAVDHHGGAVGPLHSQRLSRPALSEQPDNLPFALRLLTEGGEDLWHLLGAERPPRQIDDRPGLNRRALLIIAKGHDLKAMLLLQPQKLQSLPRAEQPPFVNSHDRPGPGADGAIAEAVDQDGEG